MKSVFFKRAVALTLTLLMLPVPARAAEAGNALPETTQKDGVQTYYVDESTAHTIYWAQGITPPLMSADDTDFGTGDFFHRELQNTDAGIYVTYLTPNVENRGYFDLNRNPDDRPQEENLGTLAAAGNVLHWWLQQNGDYIDSYLQKLESGAMQQAEGLKPLIPVDSQLWQNLRALPPVATVGHEQELQTSALVQKALLSGEESPAADLVWDFFLNGYNPHRVDVNSADEFAQSMDAAGGYFYPVFGAEPLTGRTDDNTYAFYNENLAKLLNSGHGLVLTCGSGDQQTALTVWGAEYDGSNKLARIYVTASDDCRKLVGQTQDVRAIYSLETHQGPDGVLLLTSNADPDSTEGVMPVSLSVLSLGQEIWKQKLSAPPQQPEKTAEAPAITIQPQSADYTVGDTAAALSVTASVSDGGTLSYQWYLAETEDASGQALTGANSAELNIFTTVSGSGYYYCVVTNTLEGKTSDTTSARARITIAEKQELNAAVPEISVQPQSADYTVGETAAALSVTAAASDGGALSYQWYRASDETSEGTAVEAATGSTLTVPTGQEGTLYYYCKITNAGPEGSKAAVLDSARAKITVNKKPVTVAPPEISAHPKSADYTVGDTAADLTVAASSGEGTVLSYQWYLADSDTAAGQPVEHAVGSTLKLSTSQAGKAYFYCVVTATSTEDSTRSADTVSSRALITVREKTAEKPQISTQPQSAEYVLGEPLKELTVKAASPDGGKLSYQWYRADSETAEGTALEHANGSTLNISADKAGTSYYYCVVTNTLAENRTAAVTTSRARITVKEKSSFAKAPEITAQPKGASYTLHDGATGLSVKASSLDDGDLSYQWYRSDSEGGKGTAISGANARTYKPSTAEIGITYYYCVVTNTLENGETASTSSARAKIAVKAPASAKAPQISVQPKDAAYIVGDTAADLSVNASSLDGGKLSYQWYLSDSETAKGIPVKNAVESSLKPSTEKTGVTWYYCVVTNTNAADKDLTAAATSNRAKITVKKAEQVLVKRDLNSVDANLVEAGFQSVKSVQNAMMKALPKQDTPYEAVYYDICLEQIQADGSRVPSTNFPQEGLTFTLSYPKGTQKKGYHFVAAHMITTGSKAGTVELPRIRLTNDGIQMTLTSLSPVMIAWTEENSKPAEPVKPTRKPETPSTGDTTPVGLLVGTAVVSGVVLCGAVYVILRRKKKDD